MSQCNKSLPPPWLPLPPWLPSPLGAGRRLTRRALRQRGYEAAQLEDRLLVRMRAEVWGPRPAPQNCEVYIAGLPRDCFEDEILPLFMQFGVIYKFKLLINSKGDCQGHAYLMYTNTRDLKQAVDVLNGHEIRIGIHIGVCISVKNCTIQIMKIPPIYNPDFIGYFLFDNTADILEIHMKLMANKNRDIIIIYKSHQAAAIAGRKLLQLAPTILGHDVEVDWGLTNVYNRLHEYPYLIRKSNEGWLTILHKELKIYQPLSQNLSLAIRNKKQHENSVLVPEQRDFKMSNKENDVNRSTNFNEKEYPPLPDPTNADNKILPRDTVVVNSCICPYQYQHLPIDTRGKQDAVIPLYNGPNGPNEPFTQYKYPGRPITKNVYTVTKPNRFNWHIDPLHDKNNIIMSSPMHMSTSQNTYSSVLQYPQRVAQMGNFELENGSLSSDRINNINKAPKYSALSNVLLKSSQSTNKSTNLANTHVSNKKQTTHPPIELRSNQSDKDNEYRGPPEGHVNFSSQPQLLDRKNGENMVTKNGNKEQLTWIGGTNIVFDNPVPFSHTQLLTQNDIDFDCYDAEKYDKPIPWKNGAKAKKVQTNYDPILYHIKPSPSLWQQPYENIRTPQTDFTMSNRYKYIDVKKHLNEHFIQPISNHNYNLLDSHNDQDNIGCEMVNAIKNKCLF